MESFNLTIVSHNPYTLNTISKIMGDKVNIEIDKDLHNLLLNMAERKGISVDELIKIGSELLLSVNDHLTCYICGHKGDPKLFEQCNDHNICCGYIKTQSESTWKGDTWFGDPGSFCYLCALEDMVDEDEYYDIRYLDRESGSDLIDTYRDQIPLYFENETLRDEGMEGITTTTRVVSHEIHQPNSWGKLDQFILDLVDNWD